MIIKKFVEKDSRSVMAKIRGEFGSDAVVLSSRSVGDSFEMVAAANYDEYDVVEQASTDELREVYVGEDRSDMHQQPAPSRKKNQPPEPIGEARPSGGQNKAVIASETDNAHKASRRVQDESDGPTLKTLQSELANLRGLLEKELPRISKRTKQHQTSAKSSLKTRLVRLGLSKPFSDDLVDKAGRIIDLDATWQKTIQQLARRIRKKEDDLLIEGGVAAFIGPAGAGKTSIITKIAVSHLMKEGRGNIGLITTGSVKSERNDRLIKFAQSMDIPYNTARTATQLKAAIEEFSDKKLILIDTPGMDSNDLRLNMQLAEFRLVNHRIDSYLVLPADSPADALTQTIEAFSRYNPVGVVVTKLDLVERLGNIIETLVKKRLPLSYVSDGQKVPGDLSLGNAKNLLKCAMNLARKSGQTDDQPKNTSARKRAGMSNAINRSTNVHQVAAG